MQKHFFSRVQAYFYSIAFIFFIGILFFPISAARADSFGVPPFVSRELLVEFREPILFQDLANLSLLSSDLHIAKFKQVVPDESHSASLKHFYKIVLAPDQDPLEAKKILEASPLVAAVSFNGMAKLFSTPNDPYYGLQSYLNQNSDSDIDAPEAWDVEIGSDSVVVAVVDSGVDTDHPDIQDQIWTNDDEIAGNGIDDDGNGYIDDVHGWDWVDYYNNAPADNDPNPEPDGINNDPANGIGADEGVTHGTHVSGIIGATGNNATGITGVAWDVTIMPLRAFDDEGTATYENMAAAIDYARENGADIINMSFGGENNAVLESAISDAYSAGIVLVAAAGNYTQDLNAEPIYPICYDGVIGVAAVDASDDAASFSNYGSDCVDVSAPGVNLYSTLYTDDPAYDFITDYGYMSGTSMATPVVSGIAALLLSRDDSLSAASVEDYVVNNVDDVGLGTSMGSGRVNAYNAILPLADAGPSAPTSVKAWTDDSRTVSVSENTRTAEVTPYFKWSGGTSGSGVQYYVYFGTNSSANPSSKGSSQTSTSYAPASLSGLDTTYYLRIKTYRYGEFSSNVKQFIYTIDNHVRKPVSFGGSVAFNYNAFSWDNTGDALDDHSGGFHLYRSLSSNKGYSLLVSLSTGTHTYNDYDVRDGVTYYYRLAQFDDLENESSMAQKNIEYNAQDFIVAGAGNGGGPQVRVFDTTGQLQEQFFAYGENFRGGVNVASCDLDNNGVAEIVAGAGNGGGPQVRTFDISGTIIFTPGFFAYGENFRGGVYVSCGDLDGDGYGEIVTGTGLGGGPQVRVFDRFGNLLWTPGFFAYGENFRGGVTIDVGDFDGNGKQEIVTGTGPTGGPQVRVFDRFGKLLWTPGFFAYSENFRGGVRVAAADIDGNGKDEIITAPGAGGGPQIRIFNGFGNPVISTGFMAYSSDFRGGVNVSGFDLNQDGSEEIMTGVGSGGSPLIRIFNSTGTTIEKEFLGFAESFKGGVLVTHAY